MKEGFDWLAQVILVNVIYNLAGVCSPKYFGETQVNTRIEEQSIQVRKYQ